MQNKCITEMCRIKEQSIDINHIEMVPKFRMIKLLICIVFVCIVLFMRRDSLVPPYEELVGSRHGF